MSFNTILQEAHIAGKGMVWVPVSFAPNGSSAVAATSNRGNGFTVARTSTGLFTITFTNVGSELIGAWPSLQLATAAGRKVQLGTYDATAKTLLVRVLGAAAAAAATGTITCVAKASMADTDYCTIGDGTQVARLFEFDTAGDGVTSGRVQVNISTDTTATEVAARLVTAINTTFPTLTAANVAGVITITHDTPGDVGNVTITENVANAGFLVTGMSGGVDPSEEGTVADVAADANNRINVLCLFRQTSVQT